MREKYFWIFLSFLFFAHSPAGFCDFAHAQKTDQASIVSKDSIINLDRVRPAQHVIKQENGSMRIQSGSMVHSAMNAIRSAGLPVKNVVIIDPSGHIYKEANGRGFVKLDQNYPRKPDGGKTLQKVLNRMGTSGPSGLVKTASLSSATASSHSAGHVSAGTAHHTSSKKGH